MLTPGMFITSHRMVGEHATIKHMRCTKFARSWSVVHGSDTA
jgi:hypothetical protein